MLCPCSRGIKYLLNKLYEKILLLTHKFSVFCLSFFPGANNRRIRQHTSCRCFDL